MGNDRIIDGDHYDTATVDMGAYELPRIWYAEADGTGDGESWNSADSLKDAINSASSGDEIWVKEGSHRPGSSVTDSFLLKSGVAVYGGFEGAETALSDRDWAVNETILTGDLDDDDEPDFVNRTDNSYHVVKGVDGGLLDGFTIKGGNANGSGLNDYGGGIYCYQTSPTIRNCLVEDNYSEDRGAGMYCFDCDSLVLASCVFRGNMTAGSGGGVKNNYHANPSIINCTFFNNSAGTSGGGMCNSQYSSPTVTNCIFFSDTGGEISNFLSSSPVVTYCAVEGGYLGEGNINLSSEDDPFVNSGTPAGADGDYWTDDDGLQLGLTSPCIDAANGDVAPSTDMLASRHTDITDTDNGGFGYPDYVDIGAYEFYDPGNDCACGPRKICIPVSDDEWQYNPDLSDKFPDMKRYNVCKEAPVNGNYNCFAWSIDITYGHITPDYVDATYGDDDTDYEVSDFGYMYSKLGKTAIVYWFSDWPTDPPTHAAKLLPHNCASSKLAENIRIQHDRNEMEGGDHYGDIAEIFTEELASCWDFQCSQPWTEGDHWSIDTSEEGSAEFSGIDNQQGSITQSVRIDTSKTYNVRINIVSFEYQGDDEGVLEIYLGGTLVQRITESGSTYLKKYTFTDIQPTSGDELKLKAICNKISGSASLDIDIDFISVRENVAP